MAFNGKIRKGPVVKPERIMVYGPPKVGKTTLAAGMPDPFFIDLEMGSLTRDIAAPEAPPEKWVDFKDQIEWVLHSQHSYQTLVIDTVDKAEELCHKYLMDNNRYRGEIKPVTRIADIGGRPGFNEGFGAGYDAAVEEFRRGPLATIEAIWAKRGMRIVYLVHQKLENVQNMSGPDYKRYAPGLNGKLAGLFSNMVDAILFAQFNIHLKKEGLYDGKRVRAVNGAGDARYLHTQSSADFVAGNRYGMPPVIQMSWEAINEAIKRGRSPDHYKTVLRTKATELGDMNVQKLVEEECSKSISVEYLIALIGRVDDLLKQKQDRLDREAEEAAEREAAERAATEKSQDETHQEVARAVLEGV